MSLVIRKGNARSWLEAALRLAEPYGLGVQVREEYEACIAAGFTEENAAWSACYEWDVLELVYDDPPTPTLRLVRAS